MGKFQWVCVALLATGLAACSAEIESEAGDGAEEPTPYSQSLKVGSDSKPAESKILLLNYKGGDFERVFTFSPRQSGLFKFVPGLLTHSRCELKAYFSVPKLERLEGGKVVDSVVLTATNQPIRVEGGQAYQVRTSHYNIGECEFFHHTYLTAFEGESTKYFGVKEIVIGKNIDFQTSNQDFYIELQYKSTTTGVIYISASAISNDCPSKREKWEWQTLDASGKVVSSVVTSDRADYPILKDTTHRLRLTVTGVQSCRYVFYNLSFNRF